MPGLTQNGSSWTARQPTTTQARKAAAGRPGSPRPLKRAKWQLDGQAAHDHSSARAMRLLDGSTYV